MVTGMIGFDSGSDDLLLPTADRAVQRKVRS